MFNDNIINKMLNLNYNNFDLIYGNGEYHRKKEDKVKVAWINKNIEFNSINELKDNVGILQPSVYFNSNSKLINDCIDKLENNLVFDYELWILLAFKNAKFKYLNDKLSIANFSDNNISNIQRKKQLKQSSDIIFKYYNKYSKEWLNRLKNVNSNKNYLKLKLKQLFIYMIIWPQNQNMN